MTDEPTKKYPVFKGEGVVLWENKDINNNVYYSVQVLGGKGINCFKFTPKAATPEQN